MRVGDTGCRQSPLCAPHNLKGDFFLGSGCATSKRPSSALHTPLRGHTGFFVLILPSWILWKLFFPLVFPSGFLDHIGTTLWPVKISNLN